MVRRPDDLLVCTVSFRGFALLEGPTRLDRIANDASIIFEFPPQSFGEEAFLLAGAPQGEVSEVADGPTPASLPAARIRMAGPSRVVVAMPAAQQSLAFDLPSVFAALRDWPMRLAPAAVPDPSPFWSGVDWLNLVVQQAAWTGLQADLTGFLGQLAGSAPEMATGVQDTLGGLANSLAQQAAVGLAEAADPVALRGSLEQALLEASSSLWRRYPALNTEAGRSAALTALSLGAGRALTAAPAAALGAAAQLQELPFVSHTLRPRPPADDVTALELPYRLITSPLRPAVWRHSLAPVTRGGRTELWHTRLAGEAQGAGADPPSRIRAIWSPDYRPQDRLHELYDLMSVPGPPGQPPVPNPNLIRMSLDPADRAMLVTLMAGFDAKQNDGSAYAPVSSEAKRLHLSALGALMDAEGRWGDLPDAIDLEQWRHEATLGRDHYVRVVYRGWLCPFGHAASLVKVTERRFEPLAAGGSQRVALLRQRFFIVVRQQVRAYSGANHPHGGRDFPFTSVELLTRVTPDLSEPGLGASRLAAAPSAGDPYDGGVPPRALFWPMTPASNPEGMTDFPFTIAATDLAGQRTTFAMPLLFVGKAANDRPDAQIDAIRAAYNASAKRQAPLGGAVVSYAPDDPTAKADSRLPTASMTFRAGEVRARAEPNFYPEVDVATVGVKPVQKLLGKPDFVTEVAYPDFYAQHGFDPAENAGQVFLQFTSTLPLSFGGAPTDAKSDAMGALASPAMNLLGLSRITGPVSGQPAAGKDSVRAALTKVAGGEFDPSDFFGDATLLGGIKLSEIVQASLSLAGSEVPKLVSREFPDRVEASFDWDSPIKGSDARKLLIPDADPGQPGTRLIMNGVVRTPLDPAQPASFEASAVLNNFKVNLFGFVILWFEELSFRSKSGQKPDVSVQMRPGDEAVAFGGPLEFVNALRRYIPSNGFSDPPALLVTPSGISASYSLSLPAVEVGVFALSNVTIGAAFNLPFDGNPAVVRFAFSTREHPFSLTVSLLGGGGFFGVALSAHGVQEIEAALEFGAVVAINLGVASGSVEVKAGVYFHWRELPSDKGSVELAGYVRIHGELCVLAIISVALTFHLQLGYLKEGNSAVVYGEATLTVEIEILMFSTSVSVSCRREFAGGAADPKFIDQIPTPDVWAEYCEAFAVEAA